MNAVIYCRVSSKEQVEGTSLESQRLSCEEYAHARKMNVLRVFIEEGESAKFADRTELLSLINFCQNNRGKVNVLLVWKVDRFARNVADHFNIKATLQTYGVNIVSVTEPIDMNPEGRLMETILAGFAQFDNDIRAARTVQGMKEKIQEGISPWKPPLGYKNPKTGRGKKTQPDEPDEPLFSLLQKAWRRLSTGLYTKAEIRRLMETWGITTSKGKPLSNQSVDYLFSNPYYAGIIVNPWSGKECQGQHVPMVTHEEFSLVQLVIKNRHRSFPHRKLRDEFPLRGLVRCAECQHYLTASFSRGRSRCYAYYHCHNDGCLLYAKSIRAEQVHEEFGGYLSQIAPRPEVLAKFWESLVKAAEEQKEVADAHRRKTKNVLVTLDREIQELIRMKTQSLISDEEFKATKEAIVRQKMAAEISSSALEITLSDLWRKFENLIEPFRYLDNTWKSFVQPLQFRFQRIIFPLGFVFGKIGTAELGHLFNGFKSFASNKSNKVAPTSPHWNQIYQEIQQFSSILRAHPGSKELSSRVFKYRPRRVHSGISWNQRRRLPTEVELLDQD